MDYNKMLKADLVKELQSWRLRADDFEKMSHDANKEKERLRMDIKSFQCQNSNLMDDVLQGQIKLESYQDMTFIARLKFLFTGNA